MQTACESCICSSLSALLLSIPAALLLIRVPSLLLTSTLYHLQKENKMRYETANLRALQENRRILHVSHQKKDTRTAPTVSQPLEQSQNRSTESW
ncbi:hypothetical protein EDB80DRAFT_361385 [Ilyonectria destructans]|nr:hypothetical protein EDB80DRAFT_361385 [Ilyonectria destructans]